MARTEPKPISLKKPLRERLKLPTNPNPEGPIEPFNMDAPEHKPLKRIRNKRLESTIETVKVLKSQVAELNAREIVIKMPTPAPRPRIERIAIEYDSVFGHPKALIPTYGE